MKDDKKDNRNVNKLKYVGLEERMIHLKKRKFKVVKGDVFDVSKTELKSFESKELFKQVKG